MHIHRSRCGKSLEIQRGDGRGAIRLLYCPVQQSPSHASALIFRPRHQRRKIPVLLLAKQGLSRLVVLGEILIPRLVVDMRPHVIDLRVRPAHACFPPVEVDCAAAEMVVDAGVLGRQPASDTDDLVGRGEHRFHPFHGRVAQRRGEPFGHALHACAVVTWTL